MQFVFSTGFGNPRAMENPFLLSFGVLWFRWHNYLAEEYIKMKNIPEDELEKYDEQIFNHARKWVVASHQVSLVWCCVRYSIKVSP